MKPILFNSEMVRAILVGRKTQTRRPVKSPTGYFAVCWKKILPEVKWIEQRDEYEKWNEKYVNPSYSVDDILYVRETWQLVDDDYKVVTGQKDWENWQPHNYLHKASDSYMTPDGFGWRPSIHMPKEAARIFLKVTDVRIERLKDMSEDDALLEGMIWEKPYEGNPAKFEFMIVWDSIYGKDYPSKNNPWVIVYDFERCEKPKGE